MKRFKLLAVLLIILFQLISSEICAQITIPDFRIYNKNQESVSYYILTLLNKIMIIDNFGTPIYLKQLNTVALDFNKQDDGYLYYFTSNNKEFYKLDSSYQIIDTLNMENGYELNYHEFIAKKNGDYYLLGRKYNVMDLSEIYPGGKEFATVIEDVIQVLDKNKNLKFEWKSLDHVDILDTDTNFVDLTSSVVDYMHINSFDINEQGDIYISARHLNDIIKINGNTGEIIWILGGKKNEFTLIGDIDFFSGQHSFSIKPDSKILLFDNGNVYHPDYSRGVEYLLNEDLKTIEFQREFNAVPNVYSPIMGNIQQFDDENIIVGWGKNRSALLLTEYDKNNDLVLKIDSIEDYYSYTITKIDWKTTLFQSNKDTIDFGEVNYGDYAIQQVTIQNNSESSIELSSFSTRGKYFTISNEFPKVIPAQQSTILDIKFKPSKYGGYFYDILTLNSDGTDIVGNPQRISIQICLKGYSQDVMPPFISTFPLNNSTNIPTNSNIKIDFDEPVRFIDNTELTNEQIINSIDFTKSDFVGEDILFDIDYIVEENEILLYPLIPLEFNKNYILSIYPFFEDYSDNIIDEKQIQFTTGNTTDVNTISNDGLKVFPNPTHDRITISSTNQLISSIEISDLNGGIIQKITEINETEIVVNINKQSSGILIIKTTLNNGSVIRKRIVKI